MTDGLDRSGELPDWDARAIGRDAFIELVWRKGRTLYRDLPWRNVDDPYAVLVSEVMLQQTQVVRVQRFWPRWMALFPSVDALAAADTATVLEMWQGLGYNRRALALKRACEECADTRSGRLPQTYGELVSLPGVGPATAAGVMAFALRKPAMYLETNVRSVFLHELFPHDEGVSDRQLAPFVSDVCSHDDPRGWYYALLDYGADLKAHGANPSRRSAHHTRQSAFSGSRREKRSFVLRQVLACEEGIERGEVAALLDEFEREAGRTPVAPDLFAAIVDDLIAEGFFHAETTRLVP